VYAVDVAQGPVDFLEQQQTIRRGNKFSLFPVEKLEPHGLLELRKQAAGGGLRQPDLAGGGGDGTLAQDRPEYTQSPKADVIELRRFA